VIASVLRWQVAEKAEILASSFDKLRMRLSVFNGLILMVSLSNHGQHRFSAASCLSSVSGRKPQETP
jgi:hypothetical protein